MDYFFGSSASVRDLESRAEGIARSSTPVLIEGETGAGKERLAYYLHDLRGVGGRVVKLLGDSPFLVPTEPNPTAKSSFPFNQLDCESGNTLLLKRVNRLPIAMQERLLLALERFTTSPLLISTTSEPLDPLVGAGRFIPELFYRLSAHRISLPPLRERRQDIPQLFHRLLEEMSRIAGVTVPMPDSGIAESLMKHSWPGNVRELQNVARLWLVNPNPDAILAELAKRKRTMPPSAAPSEPAALKQRVREASKRIEGEIILQSLEQNRWNRRRTAESLNISYRSLLYKMKDCDIRSGRIPAWHEGQASGAMTLGG
jgi:DNA-binding NtrC family response regulator